MMLETPVPRIPKLSERMEEEAHAEGEKHVEELAFKQYQLEQQAKNACIQLEMRRSKMLMH